MEIIEQLEDADLTLAADGYKECSYVRIAISEAIRALRQPHVSGSLPIDEISKQIKFHCREHITTSGLRFTGISWAEACRILEKYGFKDEIPF